MEQKILDIGEHEIRTIRRGSPEYPARLSELRSMPETLYVLGLLPSDSIPTVAIVGARMCSPYGHRVAAEFAAALALRGVQIISGMALGIDGYAQQSAVDAGGTSFAVLGGGVDICYPATNLGLYRELRRTGGILSEQPPGTPSRSYHFPARNRIISGLADIVLVVERARAGAGRICSPGASRRRAVGRLQPADRAGRLDRLRPAGNSRPAGHAPLLGASRGIRQLDRGGPPEEHKKSDG